MINLVFDSFEALYATEFNILVSRKASSELLADLKNNFPKSSGDKRPLGIYLFKLPHLFVTIEVTFLWPYLG